MRKCLGGVVTLGIIHINLAKFASCRRTSEPLDRETGGTIDGKVVSIYQLPESLGA